MTNASSGLHLTDTHNGLRAFNRRFAQSLHITVSDMGHASEIIAHAGSGDFRVTESPTQILYTEYSLSKGQSLMNGINIAMDMFLGVFNHGNRR
jgi:hypothetical protein